MYSKYIPITLRHFSPNHLYINILLTIIKLNIISYAQIGNSKFKKKKKEKKILIEVPRFPGIT